MLINVIYRPKVTPMTQDHYRILEVSSDADSGTIKSSYKRLTIQWHPDRNPGNSAAEERFKRIAMAYEVLSDPEKRRVYDLSLNPIINFNHRDIDPSLYAGKEFVNAFVAFFGDYLDESVPGGFRDRVERAKSNIQKSGKGKSAKSGSSGGEKCKICLDKKRLPLKQGGVMVFVTCKACL